jgi:signal transduction histidine kinase
MLKPIPVVKAKPAIHWELTPVHDQLQQPLETQLRFEAVVNSLDEGIIILDTISGLFSCNPCALRILGFDQHADLPLKLTKLSSMFHVSTLDGSPLSPQERPLARALRGESTRSIDVRIRRIDADWERVCAISGSTAPYGAGGTLAFMTITDISERLSALSALRASEVHLRNAQLQDLTERRNAAEQLRLTNESLEARVLARTQALADARVRAESADRLKSDFLATMSHELRTPLNSIIGFTSLLLQQLSGPLNPEQAKQLGMVRGGALHLLALINDVLGISRIESRQIEIRAEAFDLKTALENMVATLEPLAAAKALKLELTAESPLGSWVSDRRRLEQILLNLLNNAIKFTERGAVTLTAAIVNAAGVTPALEPLLRIRVADTGIGIRVADMASLFQPFRQLDSGLVHQQEGTGLGLAISRRLAAQLGGSIHADSELGVGSVFTLMLPMRRPA